MSRSAANANTDCLLHCSPQRLVYATTDAVGGERRVCKVLVAGSMADAEHEVAMARLCAGPGVVRYLECSTVPTTNRPCTWSAFVDGTDLDRIVAEQGALPATTICRLVAPVATTLAAMHALRRDEAPRGVCHGDVKPKNLLHTGTTTLLLDFEHALPIGANGGTDDATAARDVRDLGTTMRWLATGGGRSDLPAHPDFVVLLDACTAADPAQRPSAAAVAATLTTLALRLANDPDEARLDAVARGDVGGTDDGTRPDLAAWCQRRRRVLRRLPHLLDAPAARPTDPRALLREIRRVARVLAWFPRHTGAWRRHRELAAAAGRLVADAASHTNTLRRSEEFDVAGAWLDDAIELLHDVMPKPGGCPIPFPGTPLTAGPLHRDPVAFLRHLADENAAAKLELAEATERILEMKNRLELERAGQAIDAMAAHYGGSSPTVARCRDRLHRLGFYLDRIARAQPNVERVEGLWDAAALQPLTDFVATAATAVTTTQRRSRSEPAAGVVGLRSLQITLANLGEEFPRLQRVAVAHETLAQAIAHLTDQGWQLVAEAERYLRSVPVPVRPLQLAVGRLDTFRILEAFVDRPNRPRSQLQDALESLRLRLDQARAARDRLTEGAEHAMARGHWTTGLFEMERAVADIDPGDEGERREAERLNQRLAEARRKKHEIEAAVRRNVDLATRYGTMQDDPASSFEDRLRVLAERRDCLRMLAVHAPEERTVLYANDLREVEAEIALERSAHAEQRLDGITDLAARLAVARETLESLSASTNDESGLQPGRTLRLLEHWRNATLQCQRALDRAQEEERLRSRQRRRTWRIAAAAALVSAGAIFTAVWPWLANRPARAAERRVTDDLLARAHELPASLRPTGEALVAAATIPPAPTPFDAKAWHDDWEQRLRAFAAALAPHEERDAIPFANTCWATALDAANTRLDATARADLAARTSQLVHSLREHGLEPMRDRSTR